MDWTRERVSGLSNDKLVIVLENAKRKKHQATIELCEEEVARRSLVKVARSKRSSDSVKVREDELASHIAGHAQQLAKNFDLSAATARSLSAGVSGFRAHNLTQSNGAAKVGGLQRSGRCKIDRYVSYRVGDTLVSLNVWLENDKAEDQIEFHVFAPRDLLEDGQPIGSIRPAAKDDPEMKLFQWGRKFGDLEAAKGCFTNVLSRIAPARKS